MANNPDIFCGDSHYAYPEVVSLCQANGISYIFGLAGTKPLSKKVDDVAEDVRTQRAVQGLNVARGFAETKHRAGS